MFKSASKLTPIWFAMIVALAITACGSSSPGSSHTTTTESGGGGRLTGVALTQFSQDAVKFSRCMRSHGDPSFPDYSNPGEFKYSMAPSTPGNQAPVVKAAMATCSNLLPGQTTGQDSGHNHAQTLALLAFARCIRSHGLSQFPDPTSNGNLTHQMIASAGINLHQPAVLRAADDCTAVTHGMITRRMVAQFIAGQ